MADHSHFKDGQAQRHVSEPYIREQLIAAELSRGPSCYAERQPHEVCTLISMLVISCGADFNPMFGLEMIRHSVPKFGLLSCGELRSRTVVVSIRINKHSINGLGRALSLVVW